MNELSVAERAKLQRLAEEHVAIWIRRARELYHTDFVMPTVKTTVRGRSGGWAKSKAWIVNFNPVLFSENMEEFINQTIPHEVAHLIADRHFGRGKPHGPFWQNVMRAFGKTPRRCHRYDTTNSRQHRRRGNRYEYKCGCRGSIMIGPTRHKRMLQGVRSYFCKRCRKPIEFVGKVLTAA